MLTTYLKLAFPEMQGFSPRNLKYIRKFAKRPKGEFAICRGD
ncbi:MAG: hypothetical protein HUU34_15255 [Saprospiraceae bacterium]|nr:hypothetical protein [Saprospiraceae bacterium]